MIKFLNKNKQNKPLLQELTVDDIMKDSISFCIPSFQRGYRWGEDKKKQKNEVIQLLEDIYEACKGDEEASYFLQPIVVNKKKDIYYLIDGQQRITTLFLIYKFLDLTKNISIEYQNESRQGSKEFLEKLNKETKDNNIDFYHIYNAYECIKNWFENNENLREEFHSYFQKNVKMIWYQLNSENNDKQMEKLFTDLNAGKIRLTNAELVKALFLQTSDKNNLTRERQNEISFQWIEIERELRNEEFWYFLTNDDPDDYPTRIDLILNMMVEDGEGEYNTFYQLQEQVKNLQENHIENPLWFLWTKIYSNYQLLREWFFNVDTYNIIGYLIAAGTKNVKDIFKLYKEEDKNKNRVLKTKNKFKEKLNEWIKESIKLDEKVNSYLDWDYENTPEKIKRFLLLFNVISIGKFNKDNINKERFPFNKYKKKTSDENASVFWSLEHIDPQHPEDECPLSKREQWQEWIKNQKELFEILWKEKYPNESDNSYETNKDDKETKKFFNEIYNGKMKKEDITENVFKKCRNWILYYLNNKNIDNGQREYLHRIDNMALLCTNHNAALSNSLFYSKRSKIIEMDKRGEYIPFCTKMVFYKYYIDDATENIRWDKKSRYYYLKAYCDVLNDYLDINGKESMEDLITTYEKELGIKQNR